MNVKAIFTTAVLVLALSSAPSSADKSLEDAIEAKTNEVILPNTDTGAVIFTRCRDCAPNNLRLTRESKFYVGEQGVTLRELQEFVESGGPYFLTIFHAIGKPSVTRIVVAGEFVRNPKARSRAQ